MIILIAFVERIPYTPILFSIKKSKFLILHNSTRIQSTRVELCKCWGLIVFGL